MHLVLAGSQALLLRAALPVLLAFALTFKSLTLLLVFELLFLDLLDVLLRHMLLVMHGIKEEAALLQLLFDVLPVDQHKVPEELVLVLVYLGRHWENQAQRHEQGG